MKCWGLSGAMQFIFFSKHKKGFVFHDEPEKCGKSHNNDIKLQFTENKEPDFQPSVE